MGIHIKMVPTIAMKTFIIFICVSSAFSNIIEQNVNLSLSYHNGFLMLKCYVRNGNCCSGAKKIEFKRNDMGVCNLEGCTGEFAIPQTRDDTENYRCFCPGSDLNRAHLLVTETKSTDDGSWICECTDKATDKVCKSNTLPVSVASLKEDVAPLPNSTPVFKTHAGWVVGIVIVIIGVCIVLVLQCYISSRVRVERGNLLTRICLGKGEQNSNPEVVNLNPHGAVNATDMSSSVIETLSRIEGSLQEIANGAVNATDMSAPVIETLSRIERSLQERANGAVNATDMSSSVIETLSRIERNLQERANSADKPEWCICSHCEKREGPTEQLCCRMIPCITFHKDFEPNCFKDINGTHFGNSEEQKDKRVKAYQNYNKWGHGIIAAEQRIIILPACCVDKIREKFPDPMNKYTGIEKEHIFKETHQA